MPSVMPPLSEILVAVLLLGSGGVVLVAALGLRSCPTSSCVCTRPWPPR